ncbi:tyrosine-type recombinase/integrase [Slackia isoflavoniconvertens]|uniref:tyrosine-type recombinase/integrase n=1 Tax=Slackia isoflavoniconvertens TaxID=572010 RepID=UPI003A96B8B8
MADAWAARLSPDGEVRSTRIPDMLAEYVATRELGGISPHTAKSWRQFTRYAAKFMGGLLVPDVSAADLRRFQNRLLMSKENGGQGLSCNSVVNVHNFLRLAFAYFAEIGVCERNVMLDVGKPVARYKEAFALDSYDYPPTAAALEGMWREDDSATVKMRTYAFAAWLDLKCGVRVGEMCAIKRREIVRMPIGDEHVHVAGNVMKLAGMEPFRCEWTKGRKTRSIPLSDETLSAIDDFTKLQASWGLEITPDTPLITVDGSWLSPNAVSDGLTRIRDRCGLPKALTFHKLRHTFATWVLANKIADIVTLSKWLGHVDVATTLRKYGHALPEHDKAAIQALEGAYSSAKGV